MAAGLTVRACFVATPTSVADLVSLTVLFPLVATPTSEALAVWKYFVTTSPGMTVLASPLEPEAALM